MIRLKAKRDILKKRRGLLREGSDVKFSFIAKHRGAWLADWLYGALGVSRSGYYALAESSARRYVPASLRAIALMAPSVCGTICWSRCTTMTSQLVADALVMAIWRRGKPDALMYHSDHGSQYTSEQLQRLMADHGVVCSMSRFGNV